MAKVSRRLRTMLALLLASAWATASPAPLRAQEQPAHFERVDRTATTAQPGPSYSASAREAEPPYEDAIDDTEDRVETRAEGMLTYGLWQWSISSLSGLGPISPIHGRREVLTHADDIRRWAPDELELMVAASIAHQASDFKDRPFGTDTLEMLWRKLVDDNISVGIAQLRREEVIHWAPYLYGTDLLSPEAAIRVMTAKLSQANAYTLDSYPQISDTDRFMLLALAQNTTSHTSMRDTVDHFFNAADGNWLQMLDGDEDLQQNWRLQLRLVLVHVDWLVEQGWALPDGLDLAYWSRIAFWDP
jgi:hypothetical protein